MRFAVVGAGGVGGFFGSKLANNSEDVWFIARGTHLQAMRSNGLHVISTEGEWTIPPGKMTDSPSDVGRVDVILFCVKSYDTETAARLLEPLLADRTAIVCLQNGIENEEILQSIIPRGIVFGGAAYIYSTITAPGVVTHTIGPTKLVFGGLSKSGTETAHRGREILDTMLRAGVKAALSDDILSELWRKFIFISAVGGMTALTRLSLGEILRVAESREMLVDAMRETEAIARAKSVSLPARFFEQTLETLKKYDNSSRSSLYHDLVSGRRLEIDALSGTVVRYGRELGIPTPVHKAIYASLRPYDKME